MLDELFMIPLTTLYDDYIDRPKLTEQKNPFEYIVPPPLKWVGTKTVDVALKNEIPQMSSRISCNLAINEIFISYRNTKLKIFKKNFLFFK